MVPKLRQCMRKCVLGRGALSVERSQLVRVGGLQTRENAGMSSERQARNLSAESLRVPG